MEASPSRPSAGGGVNCPEDAGRATVGGGDAPKAGDILRGIPIERCSLSPDGTITLPDGWEFKRTGEHEFAATPSGLAERAAGHQGVGNGAGPVIWRRAQAKREHAGTVDGLMAVVKGQCLRHYVVYPNSFDEELRAALTAYLEGK